MFVVLQKLELRLEAFALALLTFSQPCIEEGSRADGTLVRCLIIDALLEDGDLLGKQGKSLCISCSVARSSNAWRSVSRYVVPVILSLHEQAMNLLASWVVASSCDLGLLAFISSFVLG